MTLQQFFPLQINTARFYSSLPKYTFNQDKKPNPDNKDQVNEFQSDCQFTSTSLPSSSSLKDNMEKFTIRKYSWSNNEKVQAFYNDSLNKDNSQKGKRVTQSLTDPSTLLNSSQNTSEANRFEPNQMNNRFDTDRMNKTGDKDKTKEMDKKHMLESNMDEIQREYRMKETDKSNQWANDTKNPQKNFSNDQMRERMRNSSTSTDQMSKLGKDKMNNHYDSEKSKNLNHPDSNKSPNADSKDIDNSKNLETKISNQTSQPGTAPTMDDTIVKKNIKDTKTPVQQTQTQTKYREESKTSDKNSKSDTDKSQEKKKYNEPY